jgi:hypothetical protein
VATVATLSLPVRRYSRGLTPIGGGRLWRLAPCSARRRRIFREANVSAAARAPAKQKPRACESSKSPTFHEGKPAAVIPNAVRTIIGVDPDVGGAIAVLRRTTGSGAFEVRAWDVGQTM